MVRKIKLPSNVGLPEIKVLFPISIKLSNNMFRKQQTMVYVWFYDNPDSKNGDSKDRSLDMFPGHVHNLEFSESPTRGRRVLIARWYLIV